MTVRTHPHATQAAKDKRRIKFNAFVARLHVPQYINRYRNGYESAAKCRGVCVNLMAMRLCQLSAAQK